MMLQLQSKIPGQLCRFVEKYRFMAVSWEVADRVIAKNSQMGVVKV